MKCGKPRHVSQHISQQKQAKQSRSDNVSRMSKPLTHSPTLLGSIK